MARLKAVLRRAGPTDGEAPIEVGGLLLDPISHRVTIDGKPAEIGPTEYRLLQFFMTHQERAYTRGQLLDQVWGGNVYVEERTVDVHIRRLRKALGDAYENLVRNRARHRLPVLYKGLRAGKLQALSGKQKHSPL